MAWQRIDDNAKAWELACAGLLWFGNPDTDGTMYPYQEDFIEGWDREEWLAAHFDGEYHMPNYVLLED